MISDPNMGSVAQFPGTIVSIFIQVFNNKWELKEAWQEAWLGFQMTILHVLGAMLCSSVVRTMYMYIRMIWELHVFEFSFWEESDLCVHV